jgi:DNA-binding PadR family transcriptional regulator
MFLAGVTGLTRGNLSTHMAKLTGAGYVSETKEFVDRKPRTEYRITEAGRKAYRAYLKEWSLITGH